MGISTIIPRLRDAETRIRWFSGTREQTISLRGSSWSISSGSGFFEVVSILLPASPSSFKQEHKLNEMPADTIVTCSPLTWDSWMRDPLARDRKGENIHVLNPDDAMNMHQKVLRHLTSTNRRPVTSAHNLACLIADLYTGMFDQDKTPEEFQFFEFFEREISRLVSRPFMLIGFPYTRLPLTHRMQNDAAMLRLEHFKWSLDQVRPSSNAMNIRTEIALLVEVEDICDELELLQKVLEDQETAVKGMSGIVAAQIKASWTGSRATILHKQSVGRMVQMAASTKDSVSTYWRFRGVHYFSKEPRPCGNN